MRLATYFYYTAKPRLFNPIHYLRTNNEKRSKEKLQDIDSGKLYKLISELIKKSGSTGCEYSDYYVLYNSLIKLKPKIILECGSGISSIVIAYYISKMENCNDYKFISCDESLIYHEQIKNIFPKEYLQYTDFKYFERGEGDINGVRGSYYNSLPNLNYDFIFIDGPAFRLNDEKPNPKCYNADLIKIIMGNKDLLVNGLSDQRILNYIIYKKMMPNAEIRYDVVTKLTYLNNISASQLTKI